MTESFDFVIVGAGAAGCVLAGRLSEDAGTRVLLVEAGPDHPPGEDEPAICDPFPTSLHYPQFSWPDFTAEVGAKLDIGGARLSRRYLQGYGLGGGSSIQGMVAFRGYPGDYNEWQAMGASGWAWEDVLPAFKRLERDLDFGGPLHGQDGPIPIRRIAASEWAPFSKAFADCVRARGYPLVEDMNADFRAGVGPLPMANLPERRVSAAMAYLGPSVRRRTNLSIWCETRVERLEVRDGRAVGIIVNRGGEPNVLPARNIVLCAGALHSPAILMRSGIGPAKHLRDHGIKVAQNLSGVGQNLMNHVALSMATHLPRDAMQIRSQRSFGQNCLRLASGIEGDDNDMILFTINKTGWHALGRRIGALGVEVHRTYSRGEVRLRSADPNVCPEVRFNLLSDERDLARLIHGLRMCLDIARDELFSQVHHEWFLPHAKIVQSLGQRRRTNALKASLVATLLEFGPLRRALIRSRIDPAELIDDPARLRRFAIERANPPHHVSSTCRMGDPTENGVVVDSDCRVVGVDALRVVDASIMPRLVRANTHIPVLMIAEHMAQKISKERSLT